MGCACNQKGREMYEVVMNGGTGRVAWSNRNRPTTETVAGRYPGSVVRKKGSEDIVHHKEAYEVARTEGGPALFASSNLAAATAHADQLGTAYVRDAASKEVVHTAPAAPVAAVTVTKD
ncbi:hypothetical protein OG234_13215 [Streptomyces sp. NBC_01420]|uniref:hypothetical protein n=1 Tax=Streptomyces sp. NBC_01420 TaxID=2903858 RepID=UPI00324B9C74